MNVNGLAVAEKKKKKDREEKSEERILKSGKKDRGKTYLPNLG